jgi:hypothetical protein
MESYISVKTLPHCCACPKPEPSFPPVFFIISVFINLIFVRGLVYVVGGYNVHHSCLLFFYFQFMIYTVSSIFIMFNIFIEFLEYINSSSIGEVKSFAVYCK